MFFKNEIRDPIDKVTINKTINKVILSKFGTKYYMISLGINVLY
jgi:hypothetical protein